MRSTPLLYRNCWKIRSTGSESFEGCSNTGYSDNLPTAWTGSYRELEHYIGQYNTWSSYGTESEGVMIAYTSVYGNTKKAVELLAEKLKEKGCPKVVVTDLAREDMAEAVEEAFRYGKIVLATTTYNGDIFPFMKTFIEHLTERNYQNKTIGLIENGSWASMAGKVMTGMFEKSKNITWLETSVKIMSSMDDQNKADIEKMAEELL